MGTAEKSDIAAFDLMKFILSLFVVTIHTLGRYAGYPIVRVAVPLFFMSSSYFFFSKLNGVNDQYRLKRFIIRNARMYAFWFVALFPVFFIGGGYLESDILKNIVRLLGKVIFGSTFASSWYISALCIGITILFYLRKVISTNVLVIAGFGVYALCCLNSNYRSLFDETNLIVRINYLYPGTIYNSIPMGLLWIVLGYIFSQPRKQVNRGTLNVGIILSLILLVLEYGLIENLGCMVDNDCYFMLIPLSVCLFLRLRGSSLSLRCAPLLRKLSTLIYCLHGSIAAILVRVVPGVISGITLERSNLFLVTVVISVAVSLLIIKLAAKRGLSWLRWSY